VFWIVVLRLADICVLEYMETMMSVFPLIMSVIRGKADIKSKAVNVRY